MANVSGLLDEFMIYEIGTLEPSIHSNIVNIHCFYKDRGINAQIIL